MDARPVSIDKIHSTIEEWMETQVIV
jgi:hypothetical protein